MDTALQELILAIKQIAPEMWAVLIRQVHVVAAQYAATAILFGVAGVLLLYSTKTSAFFRDSSDELDEVGKLAVVVGWASLLLFLLCLLAAVGRAVNPAFYALDYLLTAAGQ